MKKIFQQIKLFLSDKIAELEYLKTHVENSLDQAPEGSLILSKSNGSTQYFHRTKPDQKKVCILKRKTKP